MLNYYNRLSTEIYAFDKPIGHSFGDVEYYSHRLSNIDGKILEPAVGTGRILIPLLEKGLNVEGFDISSEMLEVCQRNCEDRQLSTHLFKATMESFRLDEQYAAIIIPTGTFLLLEKREDSLNALKNFHQHLTPGGRLIVDIFIPKKFPVGQVFTRTWELPAGEVVTLEEKLTDVDFLNQVTVSHNRYEKWRNGTLIQTELERFPLRWYGVEEFRLILEALGFEDIVVSSNYEYSKEPGSDTETLTFEAKRKK
ncbi:class I SAM-dependent methyltransferase [Halobacillus sp. A1]|uniref:class I SAM-dependent methyltransferase n=1 Tax=Halobacillus sp. A1 TaxID=2880262 RepID=UPI0020A68D75|nr:class I SAM-dependent methyltransferase [Halobacillus sp. A1]MCP3030968.1 class I SAM-dependent methyltransferase [Halobacillus sp. A1]